MTQNTQYVVGYFHGTCWISMGFRSKLAADIWTDYLVAHGVNVSETKEVR